MKPTTGTGVNVAENRQAPDDAALVREVAAGSQDALAALYDRHVDAVFAPRPG